MVQDNPTEYSEKKDFKLSKFTVVETTSFLNTSISIIDDTTGKIPLIVNKPFAKGQMVKGIKVRYVRLYSDGQQTIECLVDRKSADMIASYGPMVTNFILELSLKTLE